MKNKNHFKFILLIFLGYSTMVCAQVAPKNPLRSGIDLNTISLHSKLSTDSLLMDVDYYLHALDAIHPNPYQVLKKQEIALLIKDLKKEIKANHCSSLTYLEAYYYMQKIAACISDGHTKIYQPQNWLSIDSLYFPLNIRIVENRMFVDKNLGLNKIPLKAEILSINNTSTQTIIKTLQSYCEGTFSSFRKRRLEEEFRFFLHTYYRFGNEFTLEYTHKENKENVKIRGINAEELKVKNRKRLWFKVEFLQTKTDEVPILKLPHLGYRKQDFEKITNDFFKKYKDKNNIIIDLRSCPGGNGQRVYELIDHLTDKPYTYYKRFAFKANPMFELHIKHRIQTKLHKENKPIENWKNILFSEGVWGDEDDKLYKDLIQAETNKLVDLNRGVHTPADSIELYNGKIYLLIDHRTFSAAVVFASVFKHLNLATIAGRESGGRINLYSNTINIEMPHSHLLAKIPTAILHLHGEEPNRGLMPDIQNNLTIENYLNYKDYDLECIKEIIEKDI